MVEEEGECHLYSLAILCFSSDPFMFIVEIHVVDILVVCTQNCIHNKGAFTPAEHCLQTFTNKKRGWCKPSPVPNRVCEPCSRTFASVLLLVGKLTNAQRDSVFVARPV